MARSHSPSSGAAALGLSLLGALLLAGCPDQSTCIVRGEEDLRALAAKRDLECSLLIFDDPALTDLDAAAGIETLYGVHIYECPNLTDISVIESFGGSFELVVETVPLDEDLTLPATLRRASLRGIATKTLRLASGFEGAFGVGYAEALTTIEAPEVVRLNSIGLDALPALTSIADAFPALEECGGLLVRDAPQIPTADILALGARCGLAADEIEHCGNLDDEPCAYATD